MQEGLSNPYQKGGLKSAHNWFKHCKKSDYPLKIIEIWRPSITNDDALRFKDWIDSTTKKSQKSSDHFMVLYIDDNINQKYIQELWKGYAWRLIRLKNKIMLI